MIYLRKKWQIALTHRFQKDFTAKETIKGTIRHYIPDQLKLAQLNYEFM